jgi:predicted AlkP superfamily phosphohydrolase/phosphomutase
MNYAATIHLNLRGRDPEGQIDDVDAAVDDLTRSLLAWTVDGKRVVERVHRGADAYGGAADGAPDLVLELALRDGYSTTLLPSGRVSAGTTWRRLTPAEYVGGKGLGMNGSHRQHGVLILHGPAFRAGATVQADMHDVLPTLLEAMGEEVPGHLEGRVIEDALVARMSSPARSSGASAPARPSSARPLDAREADAVRRRLERLGYL